MKEFASMVFEVINIESERRIDGTTRLRVMAMDDMFRIFDVEISSNIINNRGKVREAIVKRYRMFHIPPNPLIQVGDIL